MAIDDNKKYALTGAQIKDIASKIEEKPSIITFYFNENDNATLYTDTTYETEVSAQQIKDYLDNNYIVRISGLTGYFPGIELVTLTEYKLDYYDNKTSTTYAIIFNLYSLPEYNFYIAYASLSDTSYDAELYSSYTAGTNISISDNTISTSSTPTFSQITVNGSHPKIKSNGTLTLSSDGTWGAGSHGNIVLDSSTLRPAEAQTGILSLGAPSSTGIWNNLYLSGKIYHGANQLTLPSADGTVALISDIPTTISGANIQYATIDFDKTATGEFLKLNQTNIDPGEGAALSANTLLAVYDVDDDYIRGEVLVSTQNVDTLATTSDVAVVWSSGTWTQFGRMATSSNKHILTIANPTANNWVVEISLDCPSVLPGSIISGSSIITTTPATGIAELDSNNAISKVITWSRIASRGSVYNRKYVTIPANTTKKFCACVCTYQTTASPTGTWEGGDEITGTAVGAGFGGPSCTLTATLIDNGE